MKILVVDAMVMINVSNHDKNNEHIKVYIYKQLRAYLLNIWYTSWFKFQ